MPIITLDNGYGYHIKDDSENLEQSQFGALRNHNSVIEVNANALLYMQETTNRVNISDNNQIF